MKKVVIAGVIVLAVVMIAIVVLRPGGDSRRADPPAFVELLGSLTPKRFVAARDVAGQACWNGTGQLTVQSGQACRTRLPERANRLGICLAAGQPARMEVRGREFGPQEPDGSRLPCAAGGDVLSLYDQDNELLVVCAPGSVCVLRLT